MRSESAADRVLDPEPTTAERQAVRLALARLAGGHPTGSPRGPAWHAAGLHESVDREPQEDAPRSNRGAIRA